MLPSTQPTTVKLKMLKQVIADSLQFKVPRFLNPETGSKIIQLESALQVITKINPNLTIPAHIRNDFINRTSMHSFSEYWRV